MSLYDIPVTTLAGEATTLAEHKGKALLIVNVASNCGQTFQYEALERLHQELGPRGFAVLGFPCNQFLGQEPGTAEEIEAFCTTNYGVTFPLFEKIEVKDEGQHPLYAELSKAPDAEGVAGDVQWNFEKFLVSPEGQVLQRIRPRTRPDDPAVVEAITAALPA